MELRDTFFTESLTAESLAESDNVIRNVRILGAESKNGRSYAEEAMRKAAGLYEGARLNFNHGDRKNAGKERPFEDWVGELRNVRYDATDKALYGDAHILASDPRTPKLYEAVQRFPKKFGLSHVAEGTEKRRNGKTVVESITAVASVDIVTSPATNAGIFESEDEPMARKKTTTTTLKTVVESAPDTSPFRAVFIEMMETGVVDPNMPIEPGPMPEDDAEADPGDAIKQAAIAAITAKISEADESTLASLLKALGMADSISALLAGGSGGDAVKPSTPATESVDSDMAQRFNLMEAENMLLKAGREASPEQVIAVAAVAKDKREALVKTWPAKLVESTGSTPTKQHGARPETSQSAATTDKRDISRWERKYMPTA